MIQYKFYIIERSNISSKIYGIKVIEPFNAITYLGGENWTSEIVQDVVSEIKQVINGELEETEFCDNHGAIICLEVHREETDVIALSMRGEEFLYSIPTIEILKLMEDFRDFLISQGV